MNKFRKLGLIDYNGHLGSRNLQAEGGVDKRATHGRAQFPILHAARERIYTARNNRHGAWRETSTEPVNRIRVQAVAQQSATAELSRDRTEVEADALVSDDRRAPTSRTVSRCRAGPRIGNDRRRAWRCRTTRCRLYWRFRHGRCRQATGCRPNGRGGSTLACGGF
jgi:hypothetical protein